MSVKAVRVKADRSHYIFDNKALVALIIPLVIEQLLAVLVGMADSVMIASVGEAAVSGVSLVDNIMILLINIFAALATGGAVVAGQYLGQKRTEDGCKAATQLVWFMTIFAVAITVVVYLGRSIILHNVFGRIDADVRGYANIYLLIVTASIPFMAMYNGAAAIFRAQGDSMIPMMVSWLMNGINVIGNAILIYGFHRGAEGVAIPTLVSRAVAAIVIVRLLCKPDRQLHLERTIRYRPNGSLIKKILSVGVPNGLENSMFQLGKILVLSLVSTFGTFAIAANAVSTMVALFQILPGMAINLAVTTVIARCVGAGDYEQVKYYNKKLTLLVYVAMIVTTILVFLLIPFIIWMYHLSPQTAEVTRDIIIFHGIGAILIWPIAFTVPTTFRSTGDAPMCMAISTFSMWVFRIGFSYVLGKYMGWGVFGVWVAMIIDWVFRSICFMIRYATGKWQHQAMS